MRWAFLAASMMAMVALSGCADGGLFGDDEEPPEPFRHESEGMLGTGPLDPVTVPVEEGAERFVVSLSVDPALAGFGVRIEDPSGTIKAGQDCQASPPDCQLGAGSGAQNLELGASDLSAGDWRVIVEGYGYGEYVLTIDVTY